MVLKSSMFLCIASGKSITAAMMKIPKLPAPIASPAPRVCMVLLVFSGKNRPWADPMSPAVVGVPRGMEWQSREDALSP